MKFLLVDDNTDRFDEFYWPVATLSEVAPFHIEFEAAFSPAAAIASLADHGEQFTGVIADFELNASRPDYGRRRAQVRNSQGDAYPVSTGLGVLDWAHRNFPGLTLWTVIDTSASHAPLYVGAAALWLNALPIDVDRFDTSERTVGTLLRELGNPANARTLNDLWPTVIHVKDRFEELLNKRHQGIETLDWMAGMATLSRRNYGRGAGGFTGRLAERMTQITGSEVAVHRHRLSAFLAAWQNTLADIYAGFDVDHGVIQSDRWPLVDEARIRGDRALQDLAHWDGFNPFTDFFGERDECVEFLVSADVRMALRHYRERSGTSAAAGR